MKSKAYHPNPRRQAGAALMIFLAIFVLGVAAILLSELNQTDLALEQQAETTRALAQAKEALVGHAVAFYDEKESNQGWYGILPCPEVRRNEIFGEGVETGSCGGQNENTLGKLPWRSLGLEPLRDGSGECLWYAVSGPYKNNPKTFMLNEDTKGLFKVWADRGEEEDTLLDDDVVAVIIAPGELILDDSQPNQKKGREQPPDLVEEKAETMCGYNYTASNYLDEKGNIKNFMIQDNEEKGKNPANELYDFLTAQDRLSSINDQIVYILREELFDAVRQREDFRHMPACLTQLTACCLANNTKTGGLPWAAPIELAGTEEDKYSIDSKYEITTNTFEGRVPFFDETEFINCVNPDNILKCGVSTECDYLNGPTFSRLWQNWKDHLFYAVASAHKAGEPITTSSCPNNNCIEIAGKYYAGVVIFSGKALEGQSRQDNSDQANIENYLEGDNATNLKESKRDGTYQPGTVDDKEVNDLLCGIKGSMELGFCIKPQ